MPDDKVIALPVKEITHLKVVLATWYSFLREEMQALSAKEFAHYLKTPVIYNLEKDEIELLFAGPAELLEKFKEHIFREKTGA